jgi:hypothetical protein
MGWGGNGRRFYKVISGHGTVDFLVIPRWPQEEWFRVGRYDPYVYYGTRYSKRLLGFGTEAIWPEYGGRYVNVPHWFFVFIFALMAVWLGRKWWRGRIDASGKCGVCGYDMRATPQRCPECGAAGTRPASGAAK